MTGEKKAGVQTVFNLGTGHTIFNDCVYGKAGNINTLGINNSMRRLQLHHSNHLEKLAEYFAYLQRTRPLPPLQEEVVVVQNIGMGRWLSLKTAECNGITANIRYLFPAELTWELLRKVLPTEEVPERDPCAPATLRWRILEVLLHEADQWPELTHYLQMGEEGAWQLAGQITKVFDQYLFFRPDWIQQWEAGDTINMDWQARLWQRVIGQQHLPHWVRLQYRFLQELGLADLAQLPKRIHFFSVPILSPGYVQLLGEVAHYVDIHVYLMNPSQVYWGDIEPEKRKQKKPLPVQELTTVGNPLLASWGRQGRDFFDQLLETEAEDEELFVEMPERTLLQRVQADILNLRMPDEEGPAPSDASVQIHSCHSPMREAEVLYDQLLALFAANPDLTPADVVIMTPDIDTYAPYLEAVFATAEHPLPYSIADGNPRLNQGILNLCQHLLELPQGRCDTESILAVLEFTQVRAYLGLDETQIMQCRDWIRAVNIRWGADATIRAEQGGANTHEHTWRYGLDRLLLGYTLPGEALFAEVLPYNDIEGSQAEILGRLQAMLDVLFAMMRWPNERLPLSEWDQRIRQVLQAVVGEEAALQPVWQALDNLKKATEQAAFTQAIAWSVFKSALSAQLDVRSESEGFMGRGITFCAMMPMRTVPFRFVGLVGMNDGVFPRRDLRASFDRMSHHLRRGDRLKRDEDRYLFLESLLSARDWLYISYSGQSMQNNDELPPSVMVSELMDYLGRCLQADAWKMVVKHPLQAFSLKYVCGQPKLFTYSSYFLQHAQTTPACGGTTYAFMPELSGWTDWLPAPDERYKQVYLADLIRFFQHPARLFLQERFGLRLGEKDYELPEREPFRLEKYSDGDIRKRIFQHLQQSLPLQTVVAVLRAEGLLPHGELGDLLFAKEVETTQQFFAQFPLAHADKRASISLQTGEFHLRGVVNQLTLEGRVVYDLGTLSYWQWLDIWLQHLALNCMANLPCPAQTIVYALVKKEQSNSKIKSLTPTRYELQPVADAVEQLAQLLTWYWRGLHEPLPFFPKSGLALAESKEHKISLARDKWESSGHYEGECEKPEYRLLYRGIDPLEVYADEFTHLAVGIYQPMLNARK